ncbi:MAG: OmpA family protein [Myxococcota bacterium]
MKNIITLTLGAFGLLAACSSNTTGAVRYDDHTAGVANEKRTQIEVEERVSDECNLPRGATYFAYDESDIDKTDDDMLTKVAACMDHGALRHEYVVVIGYADARGTTSSNKSLGLTRAEAVADSLVSHGVPKNRLYVKTYGELHATDKTGEADYARDRKVTLRVAEPD